MFNQFSSLFESFNYVVYESQWIVAARSRKIYFNTFEHAMLQHFCFCFCFVHSTFNVFFLDLNNLVPETCMICFNLWSTDTPRIRRVPVSDMCRVRHRYDTDTYNYTKLCDFLKKLAVLGCRCLCHVPVRIRAS